MSHEQSVPSLDQLKQRQNPIRNANIVHRERLTRLQKLALWITNHVGTMGFFFVIFFWTVGWLGWNTLAPTAYRFDPFPAFVLWLFISNMIQIFLMPLIMFGQNLQSMHAEIRAEADFGVDTRSERELETILAHLEHQNELILKIIARLEK